MKHTLTSTLVLAAALSSTSSAWAGLYSDDMARCLVASTSAKDKTDLVRWIFANAALHPDVASISSMSPDQREDINKAAGLMLNRLLTDTCRSQTQAALKYEGALAMQTSFQVLGQVAMQELMRNPAVGQGFGGIGKYVDEEMLKEMAASSK
jgi:hypothetical protein